MFGGMVVKHSSQVLVIRIHKKRALFALLILMALVILNILWMQTAWAVSSGGAEQTSQIRTVAVTVQTGDTLWELARLHGASGRDPRQTVHAIQEINGIGTLIVPGQEILIPQ